jgi:hypothetical protein
VSSRNPTFRSHPLQTGSSALAGYPSIRSTASVVSGSTQSLYPLRQRLQKTSITLSNSAQIPLWRRAVYSKHKLSFAPLSRRASYPVLFTLHLLWRRAEDLRPKVLPSIRFRDGRISFNASLSKHSWRKAEDSNPKVLPSIRLAIGPVTLHCPPSIHSQNLRHEALRLHGCRPN